SDREGVHQTSESRALLAELQEHLTKAIVWVGPGGEVPLRATDRERDRLGWAPLRQALADRAVLHDLLDQRLGGRRLVGRGGPRRPPPLGTGPAPPCVFA